MRAIIAGAGISLAMLSGVAQAQSQFSSITVFGDSLSDNGNIPKLFGIDVPAPPYYMNRFSNGPVYAEYLNGLLNVPAGNFADYAIGGAEAGTGNIGGLPGAGVVQEITRYLATSPTPNKSSLVIVYAGANDYFGALPGIQALAAAQQTAAVTAQVDTTVANILADVTRLAQAGVTNFVVPNLPNLGATPNYNTSVTGAALATEITNVHNTTLEQALSGLAAQLHINIRIVDVSSAINQVLADPAKFGTTNTTQECLLNAACVSQQLPYLFWDDVHPTAQSHQVLAEYFASTINGPKAIGAQGELGIIGIQSTFDAITSRTQALRDGASGLIVSDVNGQSGGADNPDKPLAGFVTGSYGWGSRDDRSSAVGFDYTTKNIYGGLDYRITPNFVLGALFGYGTTDSSLHASTGTTDFDSYQGALYATYFNGGFYATAGATVVGTDWDKITRNVFFVGESTQGSTKGQSGGLKVETGYAFGINGFNVGPVAGMRWSSIAIDGYSESGAPGLNQIVGEQSFQSLIASFGGEVSTVTDFMGLSVAPHLRVTYDHEFKDANRVVTTALVSQPLLSVTTPLDDPAKDSVRIGGGVDVALADSLTAMVDFNATAARSDGNDYQALAKLRFTF
jgi:outer membrane lipase/esterase